MPLKPGPEHLEENFHELRHGPQFARTAKNHGKKTARSQMIAIALETARKAKRARGGKVHVGPIEGDQPGRTDVVPMKVADGSYVVPSETISHMGENNTEAGLKLAQQYFGPEGHYAGKERSRGGSTKAEGKPVDCITAHGEFVIPPHVVKNIGKGDLDHGHKILDRWVMDMRKDHLETIASLEPPAQD
jgi:hypothetical protein